MAWKRTVLPKDIDVTLPMNLSFSIADQYVSGHSINIRFTCASTSNCNISAVIIDRYNVYHLQLTYYASSLFSPVSKLNMLSDNTSTSGCTLTIADDRTYADLTCYIEHGALCMLGYCHGIIHAILTYLN